MTQLVIVGGGPGGYAAAFLAADLGMEVTLVDAESHPGGVCLHRGCIPSKAFLHLAKLIHETRQARDWGLEYKDPEINLETMRKWKNGIIAQMGRGLKQLSKQRKVNLVEGRAVFKSSHSILVNGSETIEFEKAIIATGSKPFIPDPFQSINPPRLMDSTSALELDEIPDRLLIVGGGYIGLEMGTVFSALGSKVTVVEMMDGLLPGADRDLVRPLQTRLKQEFESIFLNTRVVQLEEKQNGIWAILEHSEGANELEFDRVLVSIGRRPNTKELGLETTSVELDTAGFIKVNTQMETQDPNILAIGDVVGGAMLAHKATHEGREAIFAMKENKEISPSVIPAVVFTDPEIAWAGITESESKDKGIEVKISRFPWAASGRATTLGRTEGLTKIIADPKTGKILGVGITGAGAGDLISEGVLAIQSEISIDQLAEAVHPHPTLGETLMEAGQAWLGTAPHVYKRR